MTDAICRGTTRAGQRCRARPMTGSSHCINHTAAVTDEQRRAWAARGGKNSAAKVRAQKTVPTEAMDAAELLSWLTVVFRRVITGQMAPPVGTAAASIARTITEISKAAEIEQRIAA